MARQPDDWYRGQARRMKIHPVNVGPDAVRADVVPDAPVSHPLDPPNGPGAWVQAWIWVPDPVQADETPPGRQ